MNCTWDQFKSLRKYEQGQEDDKLYSIFSKAKDKDLTVPEDVRKLTWNTKYVSAILEPRLLSETLARYGNEPVKLGPATDLYQSVGYDGPEHVLFFPSRMYAKKWHH